MKALRFLHRILVKQSISLEFRSKMTEAWPKLGSNILEGTSAQFVVITRGKEGMAIFSRDSSRVRLIPTYAREVYDVSGAGDTVISVFDFILSSGCDD